MKCETHPMIELPHMITCPLCAQEARRRAYLAQLAAVAKQMADAAQTAPEPASEGEP